MARQNWRPGNQLYPLPAVLVSVGDASENYNVFTVSWTGTICSEPAMCYISVRPERFSYPIIKRTGEFVINLTTEQLTRATDWCGVRSGRDFDKFKEMHLTPIASHVVRCPSIAESPISIECRVKNIIPLGTHDMFIAEVVNVSADEQYIDPETGTFDLAKAKPICYSHGKYYSLGKQLGRFGFTVTKKKKK